MDIIYCVRYPEIVKDLSERMRSLSRQIEKARTLTDLQLLQNQMKVLVDVLRREMDRYKLAYIKFMEEAGQTEECSFHGFDYRSQCVWCNKVKADATVILVD